MSKEPKMKLFSPETMKDEYHAAFHFHLPALALRPELEAMIRATRQAEPDVYMSLATLAYEFKSYGLQLGTRLYFDLKGIE
jgi:hypothetical protein